MLEQCRGSVQTQVAADWQHLVGEDRGYRGCAWTVNRLAEQAAGEWLFVLADDDLIAPHCLVAHLSFSLYADVVYAVPEVWPAFYCPACGRRSNRPGACMVGHTSEPLRATAPISGLTPPVLPASTLIRRELWQELGGYNEAWTRAEDQELYRRAQRAGARFVHCTAPATWTVRRHPGCKTLAPLTELELAQWAEAGVT